MDLPDKRLEGKNTVGFAAQERLINHLGLSANEPVPWSFSIREIVDELGAETRRLNERIDWGHPGHHRRRDARPRHDFNPAALTYLAQQGGTDLLKGPPGSRPGNRVEPEQETPLTRREVSEKLKGQYFEVNDEQNFYVTALTEAQKREKNQNLRQFLMLYVLKTVQTSVAAERRGVAKTTTDKYHYRRTLSFDRVEATTEDDETTIKVVMREYIVPPIRVYNQRGIIWSRTSPSKTKYHKTAVLYIDWRLSRISDEKSRRGKTRSFWRFMIDWIEEELFEELIEAVILGALKGVSLAVKGIYRTAKFVSKTRKLKRATKAGIELGSDARELKRLIGVRARAVDRVGDSADAVHDAQRLSPTGHDRGAAPANRGATRPQPDADDLALHRTFRGGLDEGTYQTSQRLVRGNLGERLATDVLAQRGHKIIDFKPSILGTNQGGIDMVTFRDGVVYLVDNKALSRTGNISSVTALTTNFAQNLRAVRQSIGRQLSSHGTVGEQRHVLQQVADALDRGSYVRAVTNANVVSDAKGFTSGITQTLYDQGIRFIDVVRD